MLSAGSAVWLKLTDLCRASRPRGAQAAHGTSYLSPRVCWEGGEQSRGALGGGGGQTGRAPAVPAWSGTLVTEDNSQSPLTDQNRKHAPHHSYDSPQSQVQVCPEGPQTS